MGLATATVSNSGGFGKFLLILLALAVVGGLLLAVAWDGSHGLKHGYSAQDVRDCVERGGTFEKWLNPDNGRQAWICLIADGVFGIAIRNPFDPEHRGITEFIKEKMRKLEQVHQYLRNTGYVQQIQ